MNGIPARARVAVFAGLTKFLTPENWKQGFSQKAIEKQNSILTARFEKTAYYRRFAIKY